jgi:acetylornithine deacetylase
MLHGMHVYELTRRLIDIESISGNEDDVAIFLRDHLGGMGAEVTLEEAEPNRHNVRAFWGKPEVVFSTHTDTVPPFISSREDDGFIYGRGACDAKGIIAAMIEAASRLRADGLSGIGLLFVVGEERNSAGAMAANRNPPASRYLINGEPTENKLAVGTKGALRLLIQASGRAAHSAYPELGESAIDKLLEALDRIRGIALPEDAVLGKTTCNIGLIQGGVAPNVIADSASAELMYRTVAAPEKLIVSIRAAAGSLADVQEVFRVPPVKLGVLEGFETSVVSFATDVPCLGAWGQPFLIGPGSIHVAHTADERIAKADLMRAVDIYVSMAKKLKRSGA